MKMIFTTLAAVSALSIAAPAMAQPWSGERSGNRTDVAELQMQFDAGVASGAISRREAMPLEARLRQLTGIEQRYGRGGFSRWERSDLRQRTTALRHQIRSAERSRNGRFDRDRTGGWDDARDRDDRYSQRGRDGAAGEGHRGDRFDGDLRVGQRFSSRMIALPAQYRDRYPDDRASYYRFDEGRVYQVDRTSGLILRMIDIGS